MNDKVKTEVIDAEDSQESEAGDAGIELMPQEDKPLANTQGGQLQIQVDKDASALMQTIQRIAMLPDFDMDRFERLYAMHNEMLATQKEQAFNEAMAKAQGEIQSVVVNKTNSHTKSGYADLSALHEGAKPIWTKHGFSVISRTKPSEHQNHIYVITEVRHAGGHMEVIEDDWPMDLAGSQGTANKTPIQAKGSSLSYARRYSELAIFDVAVKGEDNDGNGAKPKELSSTAVDHISNLEESADMEALHANFRDGYKALEGDGFARNQLIKAKDSIKKKLEKGNQ